MTAPTGPDGKGAGRPAPTQVEEDFSGSAGYTFLTGVFVAINAIRDAYLLVDAPECVHMKTQYVQGNHDWLSTLTDLSGFHRVANTALHPLKMGGSREGRIERLMGRMASHRLVDTLLVASLPVAAVTAVDYERLGEEVREATGTPVIAVPSRSLAGDWLDGYAMTLQALARRIELTGTPRPEAVCVVGNLFDREEEDCRGNVRELKRLLRALGLEPVSCWLDGGSMSSLRRAGEAGLIVSLPYARRAAKLLARRTKAKLVETDLPFGLEGSAAWLRQVAEAAGCPERAEAVIAEELGGIVPKLEWVVPHLFTHRRLGYVGDPHLLVGLLQTAQEYGLRVELAVVSNRPHHAKRLRQLYPEQELLVFPSRQALTTRLEADIKASNIDLLIGNGFALDCDGVEVMSFGFPSDFSHALYDRPNLGFRGALAFADTLANQLQRVEQTIWSNKTKGSSLAMRPGG